MSRRNANTKGHQLGEAIVAAQSSTSPYHLKFTILHTDCLQKAILLDSCQGLPRIGHMSKFSLRSQSMIKPSGFKKKKKKKYGFKAGYGGGKGPFYLNDSRIRQLAKLHLYKPQKFTNSITSNDETKVTMCGFHQTRYCAW